METKTNLGIAVFVLLILFSFIAKSQIPLPVNYSEQDGLVSGEIYKLHCDKHNFIWISAEYGFFRFDGYEFLKIDKKVLSNENRPVAFIERADTLWVIDQHGKIFFVVQGNIGQHPFNKRINGVLKDQKVFPQTFTTTNTIFEVVFATVGKVKIFPDGNFEIPQNATLQRGFSDFLHFVYSNHVDSLEIRRFVASLDSSLLCRYASETKPIVDTTPSSPVIYVSSDKILLKGKHLTLEKNSTNVSAAGSVLGIPFMASYRNGIKFRFPEGTKTLLSFYTITDCISDNEDGVWVATKESSLFYYKNLHIRHFNINSDILFSNIADICHGPDGQYFILSENLSISIISDKGEPVENFFLPNLSSISNAVYLKKHKILCGLTSNRLTCFSFHGGELRQKKHTLESISDLLVFNDTLFLVASNGIFYLDPERNTVYRYFQTSLPNNARLLSGGKNRGLMLLSSDGLYKIEKKRLTRVETNLDLKEQSLLTLISIGDSVYGLLQYWGVAPLSESGNFVIDKLLNWDVGEITSVCQNRQFLFISTTGGVWAIPLKKNQPDFTGRILLNRGVGLSSLEIDRIVCNDNSLLVKTKRGVDLIPVSAIESLPSIRPQRFEILVNGTTQAVSNVLRLKEDQNSLLFRFSPCTYKTERFFTIKYVVEPYMQQPEMVHSPHLMVFLPGFGQFRATIQFLDYRGQWTEPVTFQIFRNQPFYRKIDFYFIMLAIGIMIVGYIVYLRIALFKRKTELILERKENAHLIMAQQLNPHFTFNSLNAIHHFVLNNHRHDASRYLTRFAQLMRGVIDFSNQELIDLENDLALLQMYIELEMLRFPNKFTFKITVEPDVEPKKIFLPPFLIQPFVENAIRHGIAPLNRQGSIELNLSQRNQYLIVVLTDNGVGREESFKNRTLLIKKQKHTGIAIVYKRIRHFNELNHEKISVHIVDLYDSQQNACGTRVTIVLPKNKLS